MRGFTRRAIASFIAFAALTGAVSAQDAQQNFTLTNHTGAVIVTVNVSAAGEERWGPDILGSEVLANGEQAQVSFDAGEQNCLWDIRVTFEDDTANDERGVNLCEVSEVEFTPTN